MGGLLDFGVVLLAICGVCLFWCLRFVYCSLFAGFTCLLWCFVFVVLLLIRGFSWIVNFGCVLLIWFACVFVVVSLYRFVIVDVWLQVGWLLYSICPFGLLVVYWWFCLCWVCMFVVGVYVGFGLLLCLLLIDFA